MKKVTIENVELVLSKPLSRTMEWIGQPEPLRQLLACWLVLDEKDYALTPRIIGHPGIGKTTLGIAAAQNRNQSVYIMQCTSDTRPEDLLVTPVLSEQGKISYHASPLLSAVITGGIAVLDEGNRMSEKSWASLAGLFDNRRMVESVVAGIIIEAHSEFRAAVTMNEDSSTFEIPDYIMSRLQPGIEIPFPKREDELQILSYNLPFSSEEVLDLCTDYLQRAHDLDLPYSIRDGINAIRYTLKLRETDPNARIEELFTKAIVQILGEESLDLEKLAAKRKLSGEHLSSMNLGDFFFTDESPLNPDTEEDPRTVKLTDSVTAIPILHGRLLYTQHLRKLILAEKFDCIAVDIPDIFQDDLPAAVDQLPYISALTAFDREDPWYYIPIDPCDPAIEALRHAYHAHVPSFCIGTPQLREPAPLPPLPDEYSMQKIGFDAYNAVVCMANGNPDEGSEGDLEAQYVAWRIHELRATYKNILVLVHVRHFARMVHHFYQEKTYNLTFTKAPSYEVKSYLINPDHLYFTLGELPFVTGKHEKERYDLFAAPTDPPTAIKDLFRETRDDYYDDPERIVELSPARIQIALTFLRNLTVMTDRLMPSLFDIIEAAKGVGGNAYAVRILKSARYYPFLPVEHLTELLGAGIDQVMLPDKTVHRAVNLFRDTQLEWKTVTIKPEPTIDKKAKYRYAWNPLGMCSHVPEDRRIESFNSHLRHKALKVLTEDFVKTEKFSTSVKDGIDVRETLRNWHTGSIFVRELPPSRGKVDSVVIIFDDTHDEKYTHCATWYAEHDEESTLSFYATDPFENFIGPGIAQCTYGGVSLLFPPRSIPNVFELTKNMVFPNLAAQLTYGALLFSAEKNVAYVSAKKPGAYLKSLASRFKKHLVWIPLNSFSNETLRRLRRFHILNGKAVRSWANRFIAD